MSLVPGSLLRTLLQNREAEELRPLLHLGGDTKVDVIPGIIGKADCKLI
jgi:hypothetical protein